MTKYVVDFYATFLVTVEVEAESPEEAADKAWMEDLRGAAKRRVEIDNGLPELEFELFAVEEE